MSHQRLNAIFSEVEIAEENLSNLEEWCQEAGFMLVEEAKIEYLAKPKLIVNFLNDRGI